MPIEKGVALMTKNLNHFATGSQMKLRLLPQSQLALLEGGQCYCYFNTSRTCTHLTNNKMTSMYRSRDDLMF